ncbi:hypothetical protein QR680_008720 [Steinernema hermaphroditum]|uniref:Uncharacterized protein n=1 Tax=Steinernema hermaphroditum TaxID=289476 RepID=A0AA39M8K5_9BILA|nr:hypothetical protein QR680_008720 [Steinernema hermaphroditum]
MDTPDRISANLSSSYEAQRFWDSEAATTLLDDYISLKVDIVPNRLQWLQQEIYKNSGFEYHKSTLLRHLRRRKIELYGLPEVPEVPEKQMKTGAEKYPDGDMEEDKQKLDDNSLVSPFANSTKITKDLQLEGAKLEFETLLNRIEEEDKTAFYRWVRQRMTLEEGKKAVMDALERCVGEDRTEVLLHALRTYGQVGRDSEPTDNVGQATSSSSS